RHPAVWALRDVRIHRSDNEQLLVYSRGHVARDLLLVVVNLDPHHAQETTVRLDLGALGLPPDHPYTVHDELGGGTWEWRGPDAYVRLDPAQGQVEADVDRKSTRLNSSHVKSSYAVFCLKKKNIFILL